MDTIFSPNFFKNLFPSTNRDHFVRKIDDYLGNPSIPIKHEFLITILKYIDTGYPAGTKQKDINTKYKEADALYHQFKIDYNNLELESGNKIEKPLQVFRRNELIVSNDLSLNEHQQRVHDQINKYFDYLSKRELKKAKNMWYEDRDILSLTIFKKAPKIKDLVLSWISKICDYKILRVFISTKNRFSGILYDAEVIVYTEETDQPVYFDDRSEIELQYKLYKIKLILSDDNWEIKNHDLIIPKHRAYQMKNVF